MSVSPDPYANVPDDPLVEYMLETVCTRQRRQLALERHVVETVDQVAQVQTKALEVAEATHALLEARLGQIGVQPIKPDPYSVTRDVGPDVLPSLALGNYIPRETFHRSITERLLFHEGSLAALTVLHGAEGVGKTTLALRTIHSDPVRRRYHERRYWFHDSDDRDQLESQFHQLAVNLRLVQPTELREKSVANVLAHFNALNTRYFIVFDHADSPDSLRPYLPERGGEILVTTRDGSWPNRVEVDMLGHNRRPSIAAAISETPLPQLLDYALALEEAVNHSRLSEAEEYCLLFGHLSRQYVSRAVLNDTHANPLPIGESLVRSLGASVIQNEKDLQLLLARSCRLFLELSCMDCYQKRLKLYKTTTAKLIDGLSIVNSICRKEDVALRVELECALDASRALETFDPDVEALANLLVTHDFVSGLQLVDRLNSRLISKTFVDLLVFSWVGSLQDLGLDHFRELIQAPLRRNREVETFGVTGGNLLANLVWHGTPEVRAAALAELVELAAHRRRLGSTWSIRYVATQNLGELLAHPDPQVVAAVSKALFDRRIREDHSDVCALLDQFEKNPILTERWAQQFHLDHSLWEEEQRADERHLGAQVEEVSQHTHAVRQKELEVKRFEAEEERIQRDKEDLVRREAALVEKVAALDHKVQRQDELLDSIEGLLASSQRAEGEPSRGRELQNLLAAIHAEREALNAAKERVVADHSTLELEEESILANKAGAARELDETRSMLAKSRQDLNARRRDQILRSVRLDTMKQRYGGVRGRGSRPDAPRASSDVPMVTPSEHTNRERPRLPTASGVSSMLAPARARAPQAEEPTREARRPPSTGTGQHSDGLKPIHSPSEPLDQLPLETLKEYAALGDPDAQNLLGETYWKGESSSAPDYKRSFHWFKKAAEQKHLRGLCNLGQCYYLGRGASKNATKALELFREGASRKDPEAYYRAGLCYFLGEGTAINLPEAFKYLCPAAYMDHHLAQRVLGMAYAEGESRGWGIVADPVQSQKWYDRALPVIEQRAYGGDIECQALLGVTYLRGFGRAQDFTQAYTWIELAAQRAYPLAEHMLGFCYEHGKGVEADGSEAIRWYGWAAGHGYALSQATLATHYETGRLVPQDFGEAARLHREAALQGVARSQLSLALCFKEGRGGVGQSYDEAIHWTALAALQQHPQAEYALGWYYEEGKGVCQSDEEAVKWYVRATSHNSRPAELRLSECYAMGRGVRKDFERALWHCQSLADKGYHKAQFALGQYYFYGDGVKLDQHKAALLFSDAAHQGLPEAQVALGHCYREGRGVHKHEETAATYYRLAADQGFPEGEVYIGWCYANGIGLPQNWSRAHKHYLAAAQKGNGLAQNQLGLCYQHGMGLEKCDVAEAKKWFERAVESGHKGAENNLMALELMQTDAN